jgi:hypothetical protein
MAQHDLLEGGQIALGDSHHQGFVARRLVHGNDSEMTCGADVSPAPGNRDGRTTNAEAILAWLHNARTIQPGNALPYPTVTDEIAAYTANPA